MTLSLRVNPETVPKRGIRLAALRVPLAAKVVGANLVVVAILLGAWLMAGGPVNRYVVAILDRTSRGQALEVQFRGTDHDAPWVSRAAQAAGLAVFSSGCARSPAMETGLQEGTAQRLA